MNEKAGFKEQQNAKSFQLGMRWMQPQFVKTVDVGCRLADFFKEYVVLP